MLITAEALGNIVFDATATGLVSMPITVIEG
jgi:hypothetical protein